VSALLYRGSVKDLKGPTSYVTPFGEMKGIVFEYTDAYSVFDWGRMPDLLPGKGTALCVLAAQMFERLEDARTWKDFARSPMALALRKGNRFGKAFDEVGETLEAAGLRTHYQGVVTDGHACWTSGVKEATGELFVRQVTIARPELKTAEGRDVYDYSATLAAPMPRLVPLEVIFRFGVPAGSSLLERVAKDPGYLASLGYGDLKAEPGARWESPVLEVFTKLESTDRPLSSNEGLTISGLTPAGFREMLMKTAWLAGCLRWICAEAGLELADGKFEWAMGEDGKVFLVDAIGPDELRLLKDGVQLSKEFLRSFYRATRWYEQVVRAKEDAKKQGTVEWKKRVGEAPPALPQAEKELATQVYLSLANLIGARTWFKDAWLLDQVVSELKRRRT
jgi:phosphoribosylaminoimidazole-succinocarboxamide synthase